MYGILMSQKMKWVKIVIGTCAFVLPVTVTLSDLVGSVAKVNGASMQPALNPEYNRNQTPKSDYVFLSRWPSHFMAFERGQVVALSSPSDPDEKLIKRIIALEGDLIKTINNKSSQIRIPEGYCWVEGDHKKRSRDSNLFGPIPKALIHASASHIVWPPSRWRRMEIIPAPERILTNEQSQCDCGNSDDTETRRYFDVNDIIAGIDIDHS